MTNGYGILDYIVQQPLRDIYFFNLLASY